MCPTGGVAFDKEGIPCQKKKKRKKKGISLWSIDKKNREEY